ncbi:MAG: MBL fold metallo-hydrolase [Gammaproteobacteria bacterium]|nr:MBL fold metallo-hydrolase [Gammaproteobacteria bacterium]MBU1980188.1 MBL fold metallo-hydrolase [Gammaproteobacteria bacterium]
MQPFFAFLLFLFMSTAASASDETTVTVKVKPIKLSPHAYYVQGLAGAASSANQGFMSNAGFVVTSDGVVVFDTLGSPPLGAEMIRQIRKITNQPIRRVIVSHYHADHIYGLQAFKALGAEIWAHQRGQEYLASDEAQLRLDQRRETLFPWVDETTRLLPADKWLEGEMRFEMGGLHFELAYVGPAHSPEDMVMLVKEDGVLYSGDMVFKGRVPYVGNADSKAWLEALDRLIKLKPKIMVPGHGKASTNAAADLVFTRDYLLYLRNTMGKAAANMESFEEAYAKTSWKKFEHLPAFQAANRVNAYNTYLLMENEGMQAK